MSSTIVLPRSAVHAAQGFAVPVWIYEGALVFVAEISCNHMDSPYKGDWSGTMAAGPRTNLPDAQRFLFNEIKTLHLIKGRIGEADPFRPLLPAGQVTFSRAVRRPYAGSKGL